MPLNSLEEFRLILSKENKSDSEINELKEILNNSNHPWVNYTHENGNNLLHEACSLDNKIIVNSLLEFSSEEVKDKLINKINNAGFKPIHYACAWSSLDIVSNLIKNNANPKEKAKDGTPAYYYAHETGNVIVLNYLLNDLPWNEDEELFFKQGDLINKFKDKSMDSEFACNALCLAHAVHNEKNNKENYIKKLLLASIKGEYKITLSDKYNGSPKKGEILIYTEGNTIFYQLLNKKGTKIEGSFIHENINKDNIDEFKKIVMNYLYEQKILNPPSNIGQRLSLYQLYSDDYNLGKNTGNIATKELYVSNKEALNTAPEAIEVFKSLANLMSNNCENGNIIGLRFNVPTKNCLHIVSLRKINTDKGEKYQVFDPNDGYHKAVNKEELYLEINKVMQRYYYSNNNGGASFTFNVSNLTKRAKGLNLVQENKENYDKKTKHLIFPEGELKNKIHEIHRDERFNFRMFLNLYNNYKKHDRENEFIESLKSDLEWVLKSLINKPIKNWNEVYELIKKMVGVDEIKKYSQDLILESSRAKNLECLKDYLTLIENKDDLLNIYKKFCSKIFTLNTCLYIHIDDISEFEPVIILFKNKISELIQDDNEIEESINKIKDTIETIYKNVEIEFGDELDDEVSQYLNKMRELLLQVQPQPKINLNAEEQLPQVQTQINPENENHLNTSSIFNSKLSEINKIRKTINNDPSLSDLEKDFINKFYTELKKVIDNGLKNKHLVDNIEKNIQTCLDQTVDESKKIPRTSGFLGFINKIFEVLGREKPFTSDNKKIIDKINDIKSALQQTKTESTSSDDHQIKQENTLN